MNKNAPKTCNNTKSTQLRTCEVKIEHNNEQKECEFFIVPGSGQAVLEMP